MEIIEDNSDDNLILSDLVNDWILEPIVDSINRQNIVPLYYLVSESRFFSIPSIHYVSLNR